MTTAIVLYGVFMASKVGKTGLTPTVNARSIERATGTVTSIASGASAFTVGDGVYAYQIAAATPQTHDYIAVFITADATVDAQHVQAVWPPLAGAWSAELANLDAAISSRNATTPPTAGAVADAVWDEALAGHATAGSAGAALAAAGGAADPLTNTVPGSYAEDTGGYALGRLLAISDAAVWSPAITDNAQVLPDAVKDALRPGAQLTWLDSSGIAVDLTDATITGVIRSRATGETRVITGTLTASDPTAGVFDWAYGAADVAEAGVLDVQFNAAYGTGATPAKTFVSTWTVREALEVAN